MILQQARARMQELVAELARLVLEQVPPQVPVRARRYPVYSPPCRQAISDAWRASSFSWR